MNIRYIGSKGKLFYLKGLYDRGSKQLTIIPLTRFYFKM